MPTDKGRIYVCKSIKVVPFLGVTAKSRPISVIWFRTWGQVWKESIHAIGPRTKTRLMHTRSEYTPAPVVLSRYAHPIVVLGFKAYKRLLTKVYPKRNG